MASTSSSLKPVLLIISSLLLPCLTILIATLRTSSDPLIFPNLLISLSIKTIFSEIFNIESDTDTVVVDFINSRVVDQSALQAIEDLAIKYEKKKKQLQLRHLSTDCHSLLRKAGQLVVDSDDDPNYGLAVDYGVKPGVFRKTH